MGVMRTLTINDVKYNVTPVVPANSVSLVASAWVGDGGKYSQVVKLPGVTPHTKVDLQPTATQLVEFHDKILAFVAENEGGVVTVFAIGDKPIGDHTIQVTLTEVEGAGRIRGNTVGTTMPKPDWNQEDPNKADFIKNKPDLSTDSTLTIAGKAADAAAVNKALEGKANSQHGHSVSDIYDFPSTDKTLTKDGFAADAKVTGEALAEMRTATQTAIASTAKKYVMLGDSNAAGVGWYRAKGLENKTETTDGVFAVLREMLPIATFTNLAVSGAGFTRGTTIQQQIENITGTPDVIFVWAGGNDITAYLNGETTINVADMNSFDEATFDDSLYGRVDKALYTLRSRYPFAKICGVIRTYKRDDQRQDVQHCIYGTIARIYNKYQCSVINLNDYSNIVENIDTQSSYWHDPIHYSEKAFRECIAPVFYSAIMGGLIVNTSIDNTHTFVSDAANAVDQGAAQRVLGYSFANGLIRSGAVIVQSLPSETHSIMVGGRISAVEAAALRPSTRKNKVQYIRKYGTVEVEARLNMTYELLSGADFETLGEGRYIASKDVGAQMQNMPTNYGGLGFVADITISEETGARYAHVMEYGGNVFVGSSTAEKAYSWKTVTTE